MVDKKNQQFLIKITKIIILGFVSFSLIASAIPFYLGYDDILYGTTSINLSHGNFGITNDLFQRTGDSQFIPISFIKTIYDTAIPKSSVGIYAVGVISYLVGGFYGLLYFGPIITIILLVFFERLTTKLFGSLVGLLALLMVVADWQIYLVGLRFLTDHIFSIFFILGIFSIIKFFHNNDYRYVLLSSTFFTISTFFRINGIVSFPLEIILLSGFLVVKHLKETNEFHTNNTAVFFMRRIFSKFNFTKFLKISFFLLVPWLFFLAFWLSYNEYYFGESTTNYREQARIDSMDIEEEQTQLDFSKIKGQVGRINLAQYFLVPLIPDPLYFFLIITSNTDLDVWRSDIWVSYVTFSLLSTTLVFSLYFKKNRREVITMLLFIIALVAFYSSPITSVTPLAPNLSEHANNRYMIPASLLSFILIGFILVESWHKFFSKKLSRNNKLLKPLKLIYLFAIVSFFLALIVVMPSIQDFYQTGFHFNNPVQYSKFYEDLEKLPDKSLIVGHSGRETLLHTDTHFYPYGSNFIETKGNTDSISLAKVEILKKILEEGHTAYAFKTNMFFYDEKYFKFLEAEHGIILKDYSKTFCKLELLSEDRDSVDKINSDPICFADVTERGKKIWNVTLKWS